MPFDNTFYPLPSELKESGILDWLPTHLKTFLSLIIPSLTKQASIGQCIVKAAKPKSAIPPIPFGLAVECDHMFGSR